MDKKLKTVPEDSYFRTIRAAEVEVREFEIDIIERLVKEGKLPPNCWSVRCDVRLEFHISGTAEEMKAQAESWCKVYTWKANVETKDVEFTATELKTETMDIPKDEK